MGDGTAILDDLDARGLIQDTTDRSALATRLDAGPMSLYHGIDPSADSLHIGNFVGVLMLRRFQDAGHRPVVLIGGATGMIGDPGGRSEERNLLDEAALASNQAGIRAQLERLVDLDRAELVNNYDWTRNVGVLDFLRDVGKHATVNQMVAKDSVRSRMEGEHGISYTEFSYMLLQAFDYWWLNTNKNCELQIGGSDQWGNITAGVDLIRRREARAAHALTWPLITRADGQKYGKSADGAVWLDPARTLPYEFHQYWLRVDDRDIARFLLQLTLLDPAVVAEIAAEHDANPEQRLGQQRLADEVTSLIHGDDATAQANLGAEAMFGRGDLTPEMLEALRGVIPETTLTRADLDGDDAIVGVLTATGLAASNGEARRVLGQGGVSINRQKVADGVLLDASLIGDRFVLVQKGKKQRHLVVVEPS
jgi:tyrosyl-tRNA synthetase